MFETLENRRLFTSTFVGTMAPREPMTDSDGSIVMQPRVRPDGLRLAGPSATANGSQVNANDNL